MPELALATIDVGAVAYRLLGETSPLVYRLCGGLCLALLLLSALGPRLREGRLRSVLGHPLTFALSIFATLLSYRWPSFACEELSHDESLHVTIGIALARDPLPWRAVDGASAGCLVHYPLTLANWLGLEPTYGTARFLGLLMIGFALILLWRTIRVLAQDECLARLVVVPATAAFAFAVANDYLAYNSEQPLNLILAAALFLLVRSWGAAEGRWRFLLALGLCLGAIPLTKTQGAPAGLVLALSAYAMIWLRERERRARLIQSCVLTLGGLLPLIATLAVLASVDLVEFFLRSTFVDAASYSELMAGRSVARRVRDLGSFVFLDSGAKDLGVFTRALVLPAGVLGGAFLIGRIRRAWSQETLWQAITGFAFLGATIFGVLYPGTRFPHYLLLLLPPLTLCLGLTLATAWRSRRHRLVLGLALGLALNVVGFRPFMAPLRQTEARFAGPAHVALSVAPYLREADWLATWGLDLRYCVQTRRPFHARMPFPFRFAPHVEQRDFWLEDYLQRWEVTQPPCLVATSASAWRLEYVEPVRKYVLEHYKLVDAFVDRVYRRPVRIFVRRERIEELLGPGEAGPRLGTPWVPTCARELKPPRRLYRTLVDFDSPLPDGKDLQAGTDLEWGLIRGESTAHGALGLTAGSRVFSFLARTVADDDPTLGQERPPLEGTLRLRLRRNGQVVASESAAIGSTSRPCQIRLQVPATGDYELEATVELPRSGGVALALLRWS
ncbi:MAG: hypothetical protein JKY65_02335 [Planctomycetes bacterium]|nr:hypothetical protein [Planctomycetota bacterium]